MIGNPLNWNFLVGVFAPFRQKHIILTFFHRSFDTQSEKAYHFRAQTALK
jgi:hypothetical protein